MTKKKIYTDLGGGGEAVNYVEVDPEAPKPLSPEMLAGYKPEMVISAVPFRRATGQYVLALTNRGRFFLSRVDGQTGTWRWIEVEGPLG